MRVMPMGNGTSGLLVSGIALRGESTFGPAVGEAAEAAGGADQEAASPLPRSPEWDATAVSWAGGWTIAEPVITRESPVRTTLLRRWSALRVGRWGWWR